MALDNKASWAQVVIVLVGMLLTAATTVSRIQATTAVLGTQINFLGQQVGRLASSIGKIEDIQRDHERRLSIVEGKLNGKDN